MITKRLKVKNSELNETLYTYETFGYSLLAKKVTFDKHHTIIYLEKNQFHPLRYRLDQLEAWYTYYHVACRLWGLIPLLIGIAGALVSYFYLSTLYNWLMIVGLVVSAIFLIVGFYMCLNAFIYRVNLKRNIERVICEGHFLLGKTRPLPKEYNIRQDGPHYHTIYNYYKKQNNTQNA